MRKLMASLILSLVVSTAFAASARRDATVIPAREKDQNRPQLRRVKSLFDDTSLQCGYITPCEQPPAPDPDAGGTFTTCTLTDVFSVCNF